MGEYFDKNDQERYYFIYELKMKNGKKKFGIKGKYDQIEL